MQKSFRWLACGAALVAATLSPLAQAQSSVIDFEGGDLVGIYFEGDTFQQKGFDMSVGGFADGAFGTVDTAALGFSSDPTHAPTGNATQFYFSGNNGYLGIESTNGQPFSLDGFSAAFVPQGVPSSPVTLGIVADAFTMDGQEIGIIFGLGDTTSTSHGYPFLSFSSALDFGSLVNLQSVFFYTCSIDNGNFCSLDTRNNSQFAIDNILVTTVAAPVPEPETIGLLAVGLAFVSFVSRRRRAR